MTDPHQNLNIIVYGFDNSGKSTFCNQLALVINTQLEEDPDIRAQVLHSPGPIPLLEQINWIEDHYRTLNQEHFEEGLNSVTIFDRFPIIEEFVYGNVLRGKDNFKALRGYCEEVLGKAFLLVYCRPSDKAIFDWGSREQFKGVKENARQCLWYYDRVRDELPSTALKTLHYDYEQENDLIPTILALVKNYFRGQTNMDKRRAFTT